MSSLPRTHKKRAEHNLLRGSWLGRRDGASLDDSSKLGYRDQIRLPMISTDSIKKRSKINLGEIKVVAVSLKRNAILPGGESHSGLGIVRDLGRGSAPGAIRACCSPHFGPGDSAARPWSLGQCAMLIFGDFQEFFAWKIALHYQKQSYPWDERLILSDGRPGFIMFVFGTPGLGEVRPELDSIPGTFL